MIIFFFIFTFLIYFCGFGTFIKLAADYQNPDVGYGLHPYLSLPLAALCLVFAVWVLWSFHKYMRHVDSEDAEAAEAMGLQLQWPVLPEPGYDVAACQRQPSSMPIA